jgi:hypothetical protein
MLEQDTFQDFYPSYTGRFQSYVSASPTDASPQAATIPASLMGSYGKGGMSVLSTSSPLFWGALFLGSYLVLMHLAE